MRLGDHKVTLALFAATVGLFLIMGQYFPQELAIPLPGSDIRPVLLLEFASQAQHLDHIFGAADDPARAGRIAGMNIGNAIDYLLMPAYGLMTYSFFRGIGRQLNGRVWLVFGAMGILAALADAIENALMFRMVADMASPLDEMALLPYPVWIKFGLLAVTCGGAALAFVRLRRWVLALLCLPAPLLLVPGMLDPFGLGPTSTMLIGLGWLAMGIHAATRLRPRLQANG
ncbi:MAG: hypothetical protein ACK442_01080 [Novosphingobium sp.]|jgi:hypothetical protein|nr:hypothetical protein [Novosphingobium sp.]